MKTFNGFSGEKEIINNSDLLILQKVNLRLECFTTSSLLYNSSPPLIVHCLSRSFLQTDNLSTNFFHIVEQSELTKDSYKSSFFCCRICENNENSYLSGKCIYTHCWMQSKEFQSSVIEDKAFVSES